MAFYEVQPPPRIVLYVVLGAMVFSVLFTGGIAVLFEYDQPQDTPHTWIPMVVQFVVAGVITIAMWSTRLHVWITDEGVHIKMPPFHIGKGRVIPWRDLSSVTLRKVSPFGEFGGWGIRWGFGKAMGYVWNGKQGMDLKLNNGKRVVVTLMDIEGARRALAGRIIEVDDRLA